jgi:hypothetical protein
VAFLGLLRGRGAGTVPPEPERRQRLVDAGVESAAVTWDLAVPVCCRQSTKQSLAGHGVRDRRLDRRLVVLLVVQRLLVLDGLDLSRRRLCTSPVRRRGRDSRYRRASSTAHAMRPATASYLSGPSTGLHS